MKLPDVECYSFADWIHSTAELQMQGYGCDPAALEGDDMAEFARWNVLATTDEMHEFLNEIGWKPWATSRHVNRDQAVGEIVDALHFIGNLLRMLNVTGRELTSRYKAKQLINLERQLAGYDGVSTKCPSCKRDLAESTCDCAEDIL